MTDEEQSTKERLKNMEDVLNYLVLEVNNIKKELANKIPELPQIAESLNILTNVLQISKTPISLVNQTFTLKDRIYARFPELKYDDISKSIVDVLEKKGSMNISQLTEQVRKERGTASRRIVRERVDVLIESGILREIDEGYGRQIELEEIDEERE